MSVFQHLSIIKHKNDITRHSFFQNLLYRLHLIRHLKKIHENIAIRCIFLRIIQFNKNEKTFGPMLCQNSWIHNFNGPGSPQTATTMQPCPPTCMYVATYWFLEHAGYSAFSRQLKMNTQAIRFLFINYTIARFGYKSKLRQRYR